MFKKLTKVLIFLMMNFTFFTAKPTLHLNEKFKTAHEARTYFATHKPTIFFDLHEVLIIKNWKTLIVNGIGSVGKTTRTAKEKAQLVAQVLCAMCNYRVYVGLWGLLRMPQKKGRNKITESYFGLIKTLGKTSYFTNYDILYNELLAFSNNIFVLNEPMLELVKELKRREYCIKLYSNIGNEAFRDIKERNLFAPLFSDDFYFSHNSINTATPENGVYTLWKPQPEANNLALEDADIKNLDAIMIDDKSKNVQWTTGILYHISKHHAAIAALKALGLLD